MIVENQTIRGGFVLRDCIILVKGSHPGIVIENNLFLGQPTWRHPVWRYRFWKKWVSSNG